MVAKKTVHEKVIREVVEKPSKKKTKKKTTKKKRKTTKRKTTTRKSSSKSNEKMEKVLIENFVSLQKVMVNLSMKFDGLNTQISKLLELFEISAKTLAEKEFVEEKEKKDNHEVMEKMNDILEQNKILARGITLMHDRISEQEEIPFSQPMPMPSSRPSSPQPVSKPLPKIPSHPPQSSSPRPATKPLPSMNKQNNFSMENSTKPLPSQADSYEKSISSTSKEKGAENDQPKTP